MEVEQLLEADSISIWENNTLNPKYDFISRGRGDGSPPISRGRGDGSLLYDNWLSEKQNKIAKQIKEEANKLLSLNKGIYNNNTNNSENDNQSKYNINGFQISKLIPIELIELLKRKPIQWSNFKQNNSVFQAQLHSIEETTYKDEDGFETTGVGLYLMHDKETRVYLQQRDFYLYGYIEIPTSWEEEDAQKFIDTVLVTGQDWMKFLQDLEDDYEFQIQFQNDLQEMKQRSRETEEEFQARKYKCLFHKNDIMKFEIVEMKNITIHRHEGKAIRFHLRNSKHMNNINTYFSRKSIKQALLKFYENDIPNSDELFKTIFQGTSENYRKKEKYLPFGLYETNVKIIERYMVDKGGLAADMWIEIPTSALKNIVLEDKQIWTIGWELRCEHNELKALPPKSDTVSATWLSRDREVLSHLREFPNAKYLEDFPYLSSFWVINEDEPDKPWILSIMLSKSLEPLFDYVNRRIRIPVSDMQTLFDVEQSLMFLIDSDGLIGFNTCKFDDPFAAKYAANLGMTKLVSSWFGRETHRPSDEEMKFNGNKFSRYGFLSRRKFHFCQCPEIESNSKQTGSQKTNRLYVPGRWNIDIFLDVKASYKLADYTLDNIGKTFINKTKIPLKAKDQFEYYVSGNKSNPTEEEKKKHKDLCEYCEKDCELPWGLCKYFNLRSKYAGGSRANFLNVEDQFWRGQQIRVFLNTLWEMRNKKTYTRLILAPYRVAAKRDKIKAADEEDPIEFVWDEKHDEKIGLIVGPDGYFKNEKFKVIRRLTEEARIRKQMIDFYEMANDTTLKFEYQLTVGKPESKCEFFHDADEEMTNSRGLEGAAPIQYNNVTNNLFEELKLSNRLDKLVVQARLLVEGVIINTAFDQYKSYNLLKKEGQCKFKVKAKKGKDVSYEGATVLEPHQGFHEEPVATKDFASLYPNIARGKNMSYETKVSEEEIQRFGYKLGIDYDTMVMGRVTKNYKLPLCRKCTEGLSGYKKENKTGFVVCETCDEKLVKKDKIKEKNWREDVQYVVVLMEEHKVNFMRAMCEECFNCKDCENVRFTIEKDFCNKHTTCSKCPQYRYKAVLCEVVTRLLYCREEAKKLMNKYGQEADKHLNDYLKECGLPLETKDKDMPKPNTEKQHEIYSLYTKAKALQGLYDQRQAAFKVTCNSVYGFTGAKLGFLPDIDIAAAITGEGRRMIYQTKESIQYTATPHLNPIKNTTGNKLFDFWATCHPDLAFPQDTIEKANARKKKLEYELEGHKKDFFKKFESDDMNDVNAQQETHQKWIEIEKEKRDKFQQNEKELLDKIASSKKRADESHHLVRTGNDDDTEVLFLVRFPEIGMNKTIHLTVEDIERAYRDSKVLYGDTDSVMNTYWLSDIVWKYTELKEQIKLDDKVIKTKISKNKIKHSNLTLEQAKSIVQSNLLNQEWLTLQSEDFRSKIETYKKDEKWLLNQSIDIQISNTNLSEEEAQDLALDDFFLDKIKEIRINVVLAYVSCLALKDGEYCSSLCPKPNKLAFEKIMWPFLLFSCKRYIYEKYELGQHSGKGMCRDFVPCNPSLRRYNRY